METENVPIMQIQGKNMVLYVFSDRTELFKSLSNKLFSFRYREINKVLFRLTSHTDTGFIKIRAQSGMFDFVTYKFKYDSPEHIKALQEQLTAAKNEIDARIKAARGLPQNSTVVIYY